MTGIIELSAQDAYKYFLQGTSYITTNLPDYFDFDKLLKKVDNNFPVEKEYISFFRNKNKKRDNPKYYEKINYIITHNKNGAYAWRKIELINPFLYVALARIITKEKNWNDLKKRFKKFSNNGGQIICSSIPVISNNKKSDKAAQINTWWEEIEKKSIKLSLNYKYLINTDITNCYSSIYVHAIAWAIHGKEKCKADITHNKNNNNLGNSIDKIICQMHYGQTNGIPQGSTLMDFIAEIVLGYIDTEIFKKIDGVYKDWKILRYRDDYKIFVNNLEDGKKILKIISEVLFNFGGLRLSQEKTKVFEDVISGATKEEKTFWQTQQNDLWEDIYTNNGNNTANGRAIEKRLENIRQFGKKYPNTGTLEKQLHKLDSMLKLDQIICDNELCVAILVDIAFNNPITHSVTSSLISKFIIKLDKKKQIHIINSIIDKFDSIPNTEMLDIWIQRISLKIDNEIKYKSKICQLVANEKTQLWDNKWLSCEQLKNIMDDRKNIVNDNCIKRMPQAINPDEVNKLINLY